MRLSGTLNSLQVKWLCQKEPFAGSYPRQHDVNPISTSIVPLTDNKCILGHTLQLMSGRCHVGVDGDLGHCAFPTLKLFSVVSPLTMLKVMVAVNFWGVSLNRFAFPLGGSGKCSNSTQATSSIEAVQTFLPSQFFHRRLFPFLSLTLMHLQSVPLPRPLLRSSFVMHMWCDP